METTESMTLARAIEIIEQDWHTAYDSERIAAARFLLAEAERSSARLRNIKEALLDALVGLR